MGRDGAGAPGTSTSPPPRPLEPRPRTAPQEAPRLDVSGAVGRRRAAPDRAAEAAPSSAGASSEVRSAVAIAVDERLIEILEAPLAPGETAASGFRRKEGAIVDVLATLTVRESHVLLARMRAARAGDRLVEKLGRLTAERRHRLLAFLADARRREALQLIPRR